MRLDQLRLTAFGRFRDRVLDLGPGLTIVYGPNEAGKSTVQRFVAGMLYGFARPGLKARRMLPEYEMCRPWAGVDYRGALLLTLDDGRQLRVERDFARHRVQVYDNQTGRELGFATDARSEPLFAQEWLHLSQPEFVSTVSIGQLQTSALETADAEALAGRMAALQATGREDESAARAVAGLERRLREEVGTARARQSPLGRVLAELDQARAEASRAARIRAENLQREADLRRLQAELGRLRQEAAATRLSRVGAQVQAAGAHGEEAARLRAELRPLAALAGLEGGEAERVPAYFEAYTAAMAAQESRAGVIRRQEEEVARLDAELARLPAAATAGGLDFAFIWAIMAMLLTTTALSLGMTVSRWLFLLILPAAVLLVMAVASSRRGRRDGPGEPRALLEAQRAAAARTLADLRAHDGGPGPAAVLDRLLAALEVAAACSPFLARAVAARSPTREDVTTFTRLWHGYRDRLDELKAAQEEEARAWERAATEAAEIDATAHAWAGPLAAACAGCDGAAAATAVALGRAEVGDAAWGDLSAGELPTRRVDLEGRIRAATATLSELQGMIRKAYEDLPDVAELDRRQAELAERVAGLELQRRAMERALAVIAAVSEQMHRDFAPRLAARLGPVVADLTGGRYREVRVSDTLELTTEVPETGQFKPVHQLSAGTLDQFYFALRLGAALELTAGAEGPPIICDDSLLQYDDDRALACLHYLAKLAAEHQVILLTCHGREAAAGRTLGARSVDLA